ncbi:VOC family protein [Micromonospora sp. M12]
MPGRARSSWSSTRPTRWRRRPGGPGRSAAPSRTSRPTHRWSARPGSPGTTGCSPGARAQDGQEPAALGRRPGRPEPTALLDAGATVLREPQDRARWWVLADPEGNEFCAFAPRATG